MATKLGPGGEFDLIRRIEKRLGALAVSIGDDAATLDLPRGEKLVASTDTTLEDVHFRRAWLSMREIGYRAVIAALSDLAAMAAMPKGVLIALELPPSDKKNIDALTDGIADAVRAVKTVVIGGNIARADALGITTTVLGSVFQPLTRAGARPGDLI
jgi:thiamine-monophosphate kinase